MRLTRKIIMRDPRINRLVCVDTEQPRRRQPRADARRNYEQLLAEADSAFQEYGTDASLEAIARRAGVAIGTLYGHFPNRKALVSGLLQDRNEALFRLGADYLLDPRPLRAITGWIREAARHAAAYRGLAAMLADGAGNEESELHASCLRMADFTDKLTARAREADAIGPGVTAADVSALISAVAWTAETSTEQAERLLNLALVGMGNQPSADILGGDAAEVRARAVNLLISDALERRGGRDHHVTALEYPDMRNR